MTTMHSHASPIIVAIVFTVILGPVFCIWLGWLILGCPHADDKELDNGDSQGH